jgi:hypothetical protein
MHALKFLESLNRDVSDLYDSLDKKVILHEKNMPKFKRCN